ncbi:uncharacterized protein LOC130642510 [Hydractinia symbiolongicarpus]|uniref:uncharacterized protein LOC130642510 n=1 Tax=Hydractinia symbiolongicarpus TaxID=13093 RepID=UPI00254CFE83|nr:uncharacterized protein LOC130642510 [Hydractinia symbiolongicarpus]
MEEIVEVDVRIQTTRSYLQTGDNITITLSNNTSHVEEPSNDVSTSSKKIETSNKTTVCRFYKRNGRCNQGNKCNFEHSDIKKEKEAETVEKPIDLPEEDLSSSFENYLNINSLKSKQCKYFISQQGCRFGDQCSFNHYRSVADAGEEPVDEHNDTVECTSQSQYLTHSEDQILCKDKNVCKVVKIKEEDLENELNNSNPTEVGAGMADQVFEEPPSHYNTKENDEVETSTEPELRLSDAQKETYHGSNRTTPNCRYFQTSRGCRQKGKCKFKHDKKAVLDSNESNDEIVSNASVGSKVKENTHPEESRNDKNITEDVKNGAAENLVENDDRVPIENNNKKEHNRTNEMQKPLRKCRFFNSDRGCHNKQCRFLHEKFKLQHTASSEKKSQVIDKNTPDDGTTEKFNVTFNNSNVVPNAENLKRVDVTPSREDESEPITNVPIIPTSQGNAEICKFYQELNGCKENSCPLLHEKIQCSKNVGVEETRGQNDLEQNACGKDSGKEKTSKASVAVNRGYQNNICRFHLLPRGCIKGENCPYQHSSSNRNAMHTLNLRETEIKQLERRFRNNFTLVQKEPSTVYNLNTAPTDPDWPFVVKEFTLHVEFPTSYPADLFKLSVKESEKFPPGFCTYINENIEVWLKNRKSHRDNKDLAFRPFLKWFDKSLKDLFTHALTKIKLEQQAQQAGIKLIPFNKILPNNAAVDGEVISNEEGTSVNNEEPATTQSEDVNDAVKVEEDTCDNTASNHNENSSSKRVKKGTEMKFLDLVLNENIGTLTLPSVKLTIECERCRKRVDVSLVEKKTYTGTCTKCNVQHIVAYHSELIHQHSPVVGYLHMQGCSVFDLILTDSKLVLNCLNCNKDNSMKGMAYGSKNHFCHHCNKEMGIKIRSTKFLKLQAANGLISTKKEAQSVRKKPVKDASVIPGEALPDNGTCKHYKKSYRWLRFPCCGKLYPCDKCHDEKEEGNHEQKFATRMLCGFCSKEQPFSKDKPCVHCNANLTRSKSAHWEGGKGCRDRTKMARDDRHKTAGTGKTISRKKTAEQEKKKK